MVPKCVNVKNVTYLLHQKLEVIKFRYVECKERLKSNLIISSALGQQIIHHP